MIFIMYIDNELLRHIIHYGLHFLAPIIVAYFLFPKNWKIATLLMLGTMIIDIDHLLATPIFDPHRCNILFHSLHTRRAILVYIGLLFLPRRQARAFGLGCLLHIGTDSLDCVLGEAW